MSLVSTAGVLWFAVSVAKFHRGETCQSDFLTFYAAGRLAFTEHLYDHDAARQVYRKSAGCPNFPLMIIRPAFYAALMKPISMLPYLWAYRLWHALSVAAIVGFVLLWPGDRWRTFAVCAWSFPLMSNFVYGQDGALMLLVTGAVIRFLGQNERWSASLLSLGAAKVHLFAPAGLWIIATHRWRYARSLLLTGGILLAISFAAGGSGWIPAWIRSAMSPAADGDPEAMMGIRSLGALLAPDWLLWILGALLACLAFLVFRRTAPTVGLVLVPATGILLAGHAFLYDVALCIPLILIVLEGEYPFWLKGLAFVACLPLIHLLPAPAPYVHNAQWLVPCVVIGTMIVEFNRVKRIDQGNADR